VLAQAGCRAGIDIVSRFAHAAVKFTATFLLAWIALAPVAGAADQLLTRDEAMRALVNSDPLARRAGASRFREIGRMDDVAALVKALRDLDAQTRVAAESAIWEIWGRSGDADVDALYRRGMELMNLGAAGEAIKIFTLIIGKKPDFAEGWNKRATLYYSIGEYKKSLHDCDEVIKRNPLHFGVLAGYGLIYVQINEPERALEYFSRALKINPNMQGVASNVELLRKQLEQKRGRYI
jgi:tetratricopeptide (TPR) repeat protein